MLPKSQRIAANLCSCEKHRLCRIVLLSSNDRVTVEARQWHLLDRWCAWLVQWRLGRKFASHSNLHTRVVIRNADIIGEREGGFKVFATSATQLPTLAALQLLTLAADRSSLDDVTMCAVEHNVEGRGVGS